LELSRFRIQVGEDLLDGVRILDAFRDDPHRPTAGRAGLDIDPEDPLEALRPTHRGAAFGWASLFRIRCRGMLASPAPLGRCHLRAVFAVWRKDPWKRVRLTRGFATRAASRAMKSSGSKMTWVVPSRYGVFSW